MVQMKDLKGLDVIAIRDKNDVLKAAELFEKIGVKVFSSEKSKKHLSKQEMMLKIIS